MASVESTASHVRLVEDKTDLRADCLLASLSANNTLPINIGL